MTKPKDNKLRKVDPLNEALNLSFQGLPLRPISTITDILGDQDTLVSIAEWVGTGASIASVEMKLGLPENVLREWLNNGKTDRDGPYRAFYLYYMAASADARISAEAALLSKNPDKWLDKVEARTQLSTPTDNSATLPGKVVESHTLKDGHIDI